MKKVKEQYRDDTFCESISTAIWQETPAPNNPYLVQNAHCHGYEHLALINNRSFSEVFFLLLRGELPTPEQTQLFERLLVSCIHPGPRHPASRAAMNAAVTKARGSNILPLALSTLSGEWQGSRAVYLSMQYLLSVVSAHSPSSVLEGRFPLEPDTEGDVTLVPGFGTYFGTPDPYIQILADNLLALPGTGTHLRWADELVTLAAPHGAGWYLCGLAAACLLDLGFSPYEGELVFQIASSPGLAAQAAEKSDAPLTDMPFIPESHYVIE